MQIDDVYIPCHYCEHQQRKQRIYTGHRKATNEFDNLHGSEVRAPHDPVDEIIPTDEETERAEAEEIYLFDRYDQRT
jgi:hypothetical protein